MGGGSRVSEWAIRRQSAAWPTSSHLALCATNSHFTRPTDSIAVGIGYDDPQLPSLALPARRRTRGRTTCAARDAVSKVLERLKLSESAVMQQRVIAAQPVGWTRRWIGMRAASRQRPAVALGHPIATSGCRVLVTLLHALRARRAARLALLALAAAWVWR